MATLHTVQGLSSVQSFSLDGPSAVLGRHPACDIVLESGAVSRQHARILNVEGNYYIEDLNSRNGTYVNGRLFTGRQLLKENDQILICEILFIFHFGPEDAEVQPALVTQSALEESAAIVDDEPISSGSTIMSKLDVSSASTGMRLQVNTEAKLKALLEISRNLGRAIGMQEVLPKLLDSLFKIFFQADRGFIVLKDSQTGLLVPKAVKHRKGEETESTRISRTIVNSVMTAKQAILSADAASDSRVG